MPTDERPPEASGHGPTEHRRGHWRSRLYRRLHANPALSLTTKVVITTVGSLVLVGGLVMMVTPGPGLVGIALGLAILSTEYEWADRWLARARRKLHEARVKAEAMDPRVRRRRLLLGGVVFLAVTVVIVTYVALFDWPHVVVDTWNWLRGSLGWVPELPGM
ncbi:MAG TPA: PGPGW domain-containing protein [Nocardioidaceae bacterium]